MATEFTSGDACALRLARADTDHVWCLRNIEPFQSEDRRFAVLDLSTAGLPPGDYTLTLPSRAIRHANLGGSLDGNGDGRPWGDFELGFTVE